LFMGNAPAIILFWFFWIVIFILMIALMIAAIILIKKSKRQNAKRMQFWGRISLALSLICSIPIILVVGYILYIYIGVTAFS